MKASSRIAFTCPTPTVVWCLNPPFELAVLGKAVGKRHIESGDAPLVGAPARTGVALCKHLVFGDGALARHEALRHRSAVEQNDLVLVVTIVVVPVEAGGRLTACKRQRAHGDGAREVDLARAGDAPVVEFGDEHARADAEDGLHLVPAAQGNGIQPVFLDILIDDDGDLGERKFILFGHLCKIGIGFQSLFLGKHGGIVVPLVLHFEDELGQIEALHIDAIALQGDFVKAHRLEGGRARADTAEVEPLHPLHHAADRGEVVKIFAE